MPTRRNSLLGYQDSLARRTNGLGHDRLPSEGKGCEVGQTQFELARPAATSVTVQGASHSLA